MTAGHRILFVSYAFAPILSPEGLQATRTARALAAHGWKVTVLTVDERTSPGEQDPALFETLTPALHSGALTIVKAPTREKLLLSFRAAPLHAALHLGLLEGQLLWYPAAVRAGRDLLRGRFDVLVSRSAFPTSNVVGLALHRRSGLPWLAHFSDPWVDSPYAPRRPAQRRVASLLERRVIAEATRVTFTSQQTADVVMRKYPPSWRAKVGVIPHGYDRKPSPPEARPPGPLRMTYSGSFYRGLRTPLPLLHALAQLNRRRALRGELELSFVGPTPPEYIRAATELGLGGVVRFAPRFSLDEAHREAQRADVLVVIDAPSEGPSMFLPSKLIDYLPYRKPIFALTPGEGASADLLRAIGAEPISPTNESEIASALERLLDAHARGIGPSVDSKANSVIAAYHIDRTTLTLETMLREMTTARRTAD